MYGTSTRTITQKYKLKLTHSGVGPTQKYKSALKACSVLMMDSLLCFIEDCAAIHMLAVRFRHGPGSGLRTEESFVTMFLQLHQEIAVVLLCFHFLLSTKDVDFITGANEIT